MRVTRNHFEIKIRVDDFWGKKGEKQAFFDFFCIFRLVLKSAVYAAKSCPVGSTNSMTKTFAKKITR